MGGSIRYTEFVIALILKTMSANVDVSSLVEQASLLVARLERISVDSIWARRSSGHRGALLHWLEDYQLAGRPTELSDAERLRLEALVDTGFRLLERAARERYR